MIGLLLALQLQSAWTAVPPSVTVGDTVRISRQLVAEQDAQARVEPLAAHDVVVELSDPRTAFAEGLLDIEYVVAAFAPGTVAVAMPDVELLYANGRSELVPGDTVWIVVESVLGDSAVAPRAAVGPITRSSRRVWPLAALVVVVLTGVAAWAVLRGRRPTPRESVRAVDPAPTHPPVDRWIAAGEGRAAAAHATARLRMAIQEIVPPAQRHLDTGRVLEVIAGQNTDLPLDDLGAVLRDLDEARFAPSATGDFIEVIDRAERLLHELHRTRSAPAT